MRYLFSGGIHPSAKKEYRRGTPTPIQPQQVILPLLQHIGAPCRPLIAVGDSVYMGQKIGDGEGMCVPVHASVSGKVLSIGPHLHPGGSMVESIVIQNDFQDTPDPGLTPHPAPESLSPEELVAAIQEAGIAGMGGAAFPTQVKTSSGLGKTEFLIINACECEPYITADDTLMCTQPLPVLQGIQLLARALAPKHTIIAVEDNKPQAISALREHLGQFSQFELRILPTRYPQGAEKQLIRSVTHREVPPGGLPAHVGCAVFNVSTAHAVYLAVYQGMPLIRRIVSVAGEGIQQPQTFLAPIGTPFSVLIQAAGGLTADADRIIAGGPMMGIAQSDPEVPVIKGSGSILCLTGYEKERHPVCIRCGKCVEVCPMKLQPLYLYRYGEAGDAQALERFNLADCMECGCCSYICPGHLPLVERFRKEKRRLKEGRGT